MHLCIWYVGDYFIGKFKGFCTLQNQNCIREYPYQVMHKQISDPSQVDVVT